jgi:hypothetical protein
MATPPARVIPSEPGIYPGLDFDQYALVPAINFSILSRFRDTPAHVRQKLDHQDAPTPAQHMGTLVHMAVLEPARFAAEVIQRPEGIDRRTKAGKAAWEDFESQAAGREIASPEEWDTCHGILRSINQHASCREVLRGRGANELTIVWKDEEFDVLCKSRIDRLGELGGYSCIVDVKTSAQTASLRNWQRSVAEYAYAEQAAMYVDGLRTLRPLADGERKFLWLVCEKPAPWCVRLFEAEYDALQFGHQLYRDHLRQYAECCSSGSWPGYPEGVETAGLPAWLQKTFDATL